MIIAIILNADKRYAQVDNQEIGESSKNILYATKQQCNINYGGKGRGFPSNRI